MIRMGWGRLERAATYSRADLGRSPEASDARSRARRRAHVLVRESTTLLVASTGGHLKQLHRLHSRLAGVQGPFRWVTFDSAQSRSLLSGQTVEFVPFVGARDPVNVLRNAPEAHRMMRDHQIRTVVSTGAAVALPFFALARARGIRCHYIESAARSEGPSATGRLISRIPGVFLYTQYPHWADGQWNYRGSVFDSFVPEEPRERRAEELRRVVVTLGTFRGYGFRRLVRRLLDVLPPRIEVLWQKGDTETRDLGVDGHYAIPDRDLNQAMREADVVVAHAGVGTALAALEVGKCPVLVPRRLAHAEHVDDHQTQIARELGDRGLSRSVEADALVLEDLIAAARRGVTTVADDQPFRTCGERSFAAAG
jgi:UDP-N-acetylglucosamine--N-acetylmuramyl-(pentapeptide) pyrophosphoryl-undecaprenol N-acetylglucosamine transferase